MPIITQHTVVRLPAGQAEQRRERWQRIAQEAAKQSERMRVPAVGLPLDFAPALEQWQQQDTPGLMFAARATDGDHSLRAALSELKGLASLALFIGPEGGFSGDEIAAGLRAGLQVVSLGLRILRAETAAIVACGLCMYELDGVGRNCCQPHEVRTGGDQ